MINAEIQERLYEMANNRSMVGKLTTGDFCLSEYTVMFSPAGYYIGRACIEYFEFGPDQGEWLIQPYERASQYYSTRNDAQSDLEWEQSQLSTEELGDKGEELYG